jgi:hypothetical protein
MKIQLTEDEEAIKAKIVDHVENLRRAFTEGQIGEPVRNEIFEAGKLSHELHMKLKKRKLEPKHHGYMVKNRDMKASDPDFYMHFHPIEDLLKFLEDSNANDDPVDQTIGADFEFRVFSRRWNHDDVYRMKRTKTGWHVDHLAIGGQCDAGGRPFLFQNFDQDSISYPSGLEFRMEWLWQQAAEKGLSKQEVQHALQQLADWVSETERAAPFNGIWKGF